MSESSTGESQIEHEILTELAKWSRGRSAFFWKNTSGGFFDGEKFRRHVSPFAINGTSDVLGIVQGILVAIEVKTKTGVTSAAQKAFLRKVRECGGASGVARSCDQALAIAQEALGISEARSCARAT